MSQGNESDQKASARRRRVRLFKKLIVAGLMLGILIPIVCCAVLFAKVHRINRTLEALEEQLAELASQNREQKELLQGWLEESGSTGGGEAASGQAGSKMQESSTLSHGGQEALVEEPRVHKVYLTFDDGPSIYTQDILDILERYQVKATFFVVGKEDAASEEALSRIAEEGHTLGMHSYSHRYQELYQSEEAFAEDFQRIQDHIYQVTGVKSLRYRFPGGSSNTVSSTDMQELIAYLDSQGVEYYDWNVSSGDGGSRRLSVETLVQNSIEGITDRGTSIILLHDAAEKSTTVEALPIIIENILAMEDTVILPITDDTTPVHHIE